MKRIIPNSVPLFMLGFLLNACGTNSSRHKEDAQDSIIIFAEDSVLSDEKYLAEDTSEYRGYLIVEHDDIKLYADYCLLAKDSKYGDDISAKDETYLIRYVNDVPRDSMVLKGPYNRLSGNGRMCRITVGTDTVNVDITKPFNKYLDLRFAGVLPGYRFYRFSKHYRLNDLSFPTDFQINLAVQDYMPGHIRKFINEAVRDDVSCYFADYSDDKISYPHIPLFNVRNGDFAQLSKYYYRQFCRLYKKENSSGAEAGEIPLGPHYSYQFYAYPVWKSLDSSLITWKFYNYCYLGGAHGSETEYFLTFDNNSGRILGAEDFYTANEFKQAIDLLDHQLNAYHNRGDSDESRYSADLDMDSYINAAQNEILNEVTGGKLYPRPALTRQGIVFTYQTYEKGSNADGILHFTQSYIKAPSRKKY